LCLVNRKNKVKHEFFVTDGLERVYNVARGFLGQALEGKLKEIKDL